MKTHTLLGPSRSLRDVMTLAHAFAQTHAKVLITGESGVGKEVLAHYIHEHSLRRDKRLVTINCAGVAETLLESELFGHVRGSFTGAHRDRRGLLEAAHGGTVLLDEIGEMSTRMQTLLLRFLETGEIQRVGAEHTERRLDVRLIAATNRNLFEDTRRKTFREDLYYRINVVHLVVPPLRDRPEDIQPLFEHFLRLASEAAGVAMSSLTPEVMAHLVSYRWPGNVRELRNVAEQLAVRRGGGEVTLGDLPRDVFATHMPPDPVTAVAPGGLSLAAIFYDRMVEGGESFWNVVYEPFMLHDVTRETLRTVIRRGLEQTNGNYVSLTRLFNLPPTDYKRFLVFLQKHDSHMPFKRYRLPPRGAAGPQREAC